MWYKEALIYEVHVRAFYDGDGNGIGDFRGMLEKLDYIQALGVSALWLLPFYPSPWRDDGYDVSDYVGIHPAYGQLDDFRAFLDECKRRNLKVITELILNHTSDKHPWFERARRSPAGSRWREFYVWSDTPDRYESSRIIFRDFECSNWTWDEEAKAYYWHRFYSHQPDLNYDSPDVRRAIRETVEFWFELGVDGLRLDAVPYLFERDGTTCENLPETHEFLRDLRSYIDSRWKDRMLLAEANQWPEDAAAYFGQGDECHMAFYFPLMPRLFMAMRMEDAFPVENIVNETPEIPANCQWATFLRNHDELTLEMVCAEERDYMYRTYAMDPDMRLNLGIRRRLAPLLNNDRRRIELINALLFSLPGTPVIYYGDEIGMGDDLSMGDRNGVRTPMQWNAERNAGFSPAEPECLYLPVIREGEYNYTSVNVEAQERNGTSLLWWMRRALSIRQSSTALTRGGIQFLASDNRHILAFVRQSPDETVVVVANLSRLAQPVRLRLGGLADLTPVEMFGQVDFPVIGRDPYPLTLSPYAFYWFVLRRQEPECRSADAGRDCAAITLPSFASLFEVDSRPLLASILRGFLQNGTQNASRKVTYTEVIDTVRFGQMSSLVTVRVNFEGGDPELQLIPLAIAMIAEGEAGTSRERKRQVVAALDTQSGDRGVLYVSRDTGSIGNGLLSLIVREGLLKSDSGTLQGIRIDPSAESISPSEICLVPDEASFEQRNASICFSDQFILKLFRRLDAGPQPDLEVVRFLRERSGFRHVTPTIGAVQYSVDGQNDVTAGVLYAFVDCRYDLWRLFLRECTSFLEQAMMLGRKTSSSEHEALELIQNGIERARMLGKNSAEMHEALGSAPDLPDFAPEPVDPFFLRGECHALTAMARRVLRELGASASTLAPECHDSVEVIARRQDAIEAAFNRLLSIGTFGSRIRIHGDFHLGQVLDTGKDLVIIDFEGDSTLPLPQRLIKRSPLVDVAGMKYSFRYAATTAIKRALSGILPRSADREKHSVWVRFWAHKLETAYVESYWRGIQDSGLVPDVRADFDAMLDVYLIAKAMYQVGYELENRAAHLPIALETLRTLVGELKPVETS